jgi:hypothetical protein
MQAQITIDASPPAPLSFCEVCGRRVAPERLELVKTTIPGPPALKGCVITFGWFACSACAGAGEPAGGEE